MRTLREGIVRGAASDARRPRRSRARSGVAGNRAGTWRLRGEGSFRRPLRDGRRRRRQIGSEKKIDMHARIAVIQKPPVLLDRDGTIGKAIEAIVEAGASLLVFPEAWIPGYPT